MNWGEVIKAAWKSLLSNKMRSILTMLGVIIGVAAVIIMMAISAGTEATIAESINGLGSNLVFIQSSVQRGGPGAMNQNRQSGLVYDDVAAIKEKVSGISGITVDQQATETVKYGDTTLDDVAIVGTTTDYLTVRDLTVGNGRFFNETEYDKASKVVVLGSDIATELFGTDDPVGEKVTVGNEKLTVVGVLAPKGLSAGTNYDEQIYTSINLVFKKFTPFMFARFMGDQVRQIIVSVDKNYKMDDVVNQITLLLATRHNLSLDSLDFTTRTQADIIATQESTTSSFRTLLAWVAGVSLVVGGIGIMNIMLVSVTERTREIGLRQAIGATPRDIQVQFLSEALMLSLIGGIIGVIAGVTGGVFFGAVSGMRTVLAPYSIIISFTSAALIGIFFGYFPAQTAAKLDPIVALRHE